MSIVIVGTDTGVGKTVVSAIALWRYGADRDVAYLKPIATGLSESRDVDDVRRWVEGQRTVLDEIVSFDPPVSPHLAARWSSRPIDLEDIARRCGDLAQKQPLILEGVGGVLTPLHDRGEVFADLVARLGWPVLVVARSSLGTINHTLLTLEALRRRDITIAGVVINGPKNADNTEAIARFAKPPFICEVNAIEPLDPDGIQQAAKHFDPNGAILPYLDAQTSPSVHADDWARLDRIHVWHPYTQMQTAPAPIPIARADGAYLVAHDGRRILDGISSWWVNIHGHNHPRLVAAIHDQANALSQILFAGLTHEPASRLAQALVSRAPRNLKRVFYSDDGSTAVEVAMKIAVGAWRNRGEPKRNTFIALHHGFHGETFGAMGLGKSGPFFQAYEDMVPNVVHVRAACCRTSERCGGHALPDLVDVLRKKEREIACIVVEPMVQGAGGMRVHPVSFYAEIGQAARAHRIPLVVDEVFTGFGRTGAMFASELAGLEPDILCLSKALTGGMLPLGATLVTEELYGDFLSDDRRRALFHGHSYTANALACASALASLALFDEAKVLDRVKALERLFLAQRERLFALDAVHDVRVLGGLLAIELRAPQSSPSRDNASDGYFDHRGPRLAEAFLNRGILLRPLGDVLYFLPPYVITDDEAHWVVRQIEEVLATML